MFAADTIATNAAVRTLINKEIDLTPKFFVTTTPTTAAYGCSKLSGSIPDGLFGNISGTPASSMFRNLFDGRHNLTGESAKIGDKYLYEIWPNATRDQVAACYYGTTKLTDYGAIPNEWQ